VKALRLRHWLAALSILALAAPATAALISSAWHPPRGLVQRPLWPGAPPDADMVHSPPEHSETAINPKRFAGLPVTGVYDVSVPTLTIFPARGKPNGAAVVVFPGGGFKQLAIDLEGSEACDWLNARGFVCALVKYRVPDSDQHYDPKCHCGVEPKHWTALEDAQRAIRLVRANAKSLGINPAKIGVMGFSAGGYLVAETSNVFPPAYAPVDAIDRLASRPDFAIALYPGHLCRDGRSLVPKIKVTKETPPTFLLQAWDDPTDPICNSTQYARALAEAGVPAEVHLFAQGGHAFAFRSTGTTIDRWPTLLEAWLRQLYVLKR
jgi:acetyl esterase/lipase